MRRGLIRQENHFTEAQPKGTLSRTAMGRDVLERLTTIGGAPPSPLQPPPPHRRRGDPAKSPPLPPLFSSDTSLAMGGLERTAGST